MWYYHIFPSFLFRASGSPSFPLLDLLDALHGALNANAKPAVLAESGTASGLGDRAAGSQFMGLAQLCCSTVHPFPQLALSISLQAAFQDTLGWGGNIDNWSELGYSQRSGTTSEAGFTFQASLSQLHSNRHFASGVTGTSGQHPVQAPLLKAEPAAVGCPGHIQLGLSGQPVPMFKHPASSNH